MGLFDIFTGDPYKEAAAQQRSYLSGISEQQQAAINAARTAGLEALRGGQTSAVGAIGPAITQGRADIGEAVNPALSALYGGQTLGAAALGGAVDPAIAALYGGVGAATGAYDPLAAAAQRYGGFGTGAATALSNALGINGPGGNAQAQQAFQVSPGYQFQLGQGLDALTRAANVGGGLLGGNALREAQNYGSGLASQEWQKYLSNLQNLSGQYSPLEAQALATTAAGQAAPWMNAGVNAANIYTGTGGRLADLFSRTGTSGAGVYTGAGQSLADLAKTGGLATADVYSNEAAREAALQQSLAQLQTGALGNIGGQVAGTYGAEANAAMQGSGNLWGLLNLGIGAAGAAGKLGWQPFAKG